MAPQYLGQLRRALEAMEPRGGSVEGGLLQRTMRHALAMGSTWKKAEQPVLVQWVGVGQVGCWMHVSLIGAPLEAMHRLLLRILLRMLQ